MNVEVIAIGNEVLSGHIINSNAAFISQGLQYIGFVVTRHTVLSDDPEQLKKGLQEALQRSTLVVTTGGLGPTFDDLSRQVAAEIFESDFYYDSDIADDIIKRFGEKLSCYKDQATIPKKATPLKNAIGTAPGLIFNRNDVTLIMLPGVPAEMKPMFTEKVVPYLEKSFPSSSRYYVKHLSYFDVCEAEIDPYIRQLQAQYPQIQFGIYPDLGKVGVNLSIKAKNQTEADSQFDAPAKVLTKPFAKNLFQSPSGTLEEAVHLRFIEKKITLSAAESCTGGHFSTSLTQWPGASQYFLGSIVAYSNGLKTKLLNVPSEVIQDKGAVSAEVVRMMLKGLFDKTGSDFGVAVTGIAGPTGGSVEKPVGTVWCAAGKRGEEPLVWCLKAIGNRSTIITKSVCALLSKLLVLTRS